MKVSRGRVSERGVRLWRVDAGALRSAVGEAGARELPAARPGTENRRQTGSAGQRDAYRPCGSGPRGAPAANGRAGFPLISPIPLRAPLGCAR